MFETINDSFTVPLENGEDCDLGLFVIDKNGNTMLRIDDRVIAGTNVNIRFSEEEQEF
ncbi:MAG: hypothetical protein QXP36_14090 [Conexivisphaerales archaeon]